MWAPDFTVEPADPENTGVAVMPVAIDAAGTDGKPQLRIKLLPYGTFRGSDGSGPWILRDKAQAQDVIAATRDFQRGRNLVLDYDHQSVLVARPMGGGQAGEIKPASLSAQNDGIYANVDWTIVAQTAVKEKQYRYIAAHVRADRNTGLIYRLLGAGLTNSPNTIDYPELASQGAAGLTSEERAICAAVGVSPAAFLKARDGDKFKASVRARLSDEERAICSALGVNEIEFLEQKLRKASLSANSRLTVEERAICAATGVSETDFLCARTMAA